MVNELPKNLQVTGSLRCHINESLLVSLCLFRLNSADHLHVLCELESRNVGGAAKDASKSSVFIQLRDREKQDPSRISNRFDRIVALLLDPGSLEAQSVAKSKLRIHQAGLHYDGVSKQGIDAKSNIIGTYSIVTSSLVTVNLFHSSLKASRSWCSMQLRMDMGKWASESLE